MFKTEADYFADKSHVSNSMLGRLMEDEELFTLWMAGDYQYETTEPMTIGSLMHYYIFKEYSKEELEAPLVKVVDDFNLRSNKGKEYYAEMIKDLPDGYEFIKKASHDRVLEDVDRALDNQVFKDYMQYHLDNYMLRFEVTRTSEESVLFDSERVKVPTKGKVDIECLDVDMNVVKMIDLKSTSSIKKFRASVRMYGYNRQFVFYSKLENLDPFAPDVFDFLVVEKGTSRVAIFQTDRRAFIDESTAAYHNAMQRYLQWSAGHGTELVTHKL